MIPSALAADMALPPYWTLGYEMAFYLLATALVTLKLQRLSVQTSLIASGFGIFLAPLLADRSADVLSASFFWLGTMLQAQSSTAGSWARYARQAWPRAWQALSSLVWRPRSPASTAFPGRGPLPFALLAHRHRVGQRVRPLPFVLALRRRSIPWLIGLGTISYSMYLIHEIVIALIPGELPGLVQIACVYTITVGVSALTYRYIKAAAITIGRSYAYRYKTMPDAGAGPNTTRWT